MGILLPRLATITVVWTIDVLMMASRGLRASLITDLIETVGQIKSPMYEYMLC